MKALLAACKPLILLDFHRSFNDTRTTLGALKLLGFKAPLLFLAFVFPFCFPFRLRDLADEGIHDNVQ